MLLLLLLFVPTRHVTHVPALECSLGVLQPWATSINLARLRVIQPTVSLMSTWWDQLDLSFRRQISDQGLWCSGNLYVFRCFVRQSIETIRGAGLDNLPPEFWTKAFFVLVPGWQDLCLEPSGYSIAPKCIPGGLYRGEEHGQDGDGESSCGWLRKRSCPVLPYRTHT